MENLEKAIAKIKEALPGNEPIPLFTGRIDMRGTADNDDTHHQNARRGCQQGDIRTA